MKFNEWLKDLLKKAGVDLTDPDVAATLGASGLKEIDVPPALDSQFYKGIYTKEAAENDPHLKKLYSSAAKGEYFTIVDSSINQVLRDLGFDSDYIKDLNLKSSDEANERVDTKKKIRNFGEEVKKMLADTKGKDDTNKDKGGEEIRKIQEQLMSQMRELEDKHKTELEAQKEKFKIEKISHALRSKISSFNLIDMSEESKSDLANAKINKILSNYLLVENEAGGVDIRDKKNPEMGVYDEKKNKLTINDLLNAELSDFVKKSDTQSSVSVPQNRSPFSVPQTPAKKQTLQEQNAQRAAEEAKKLVSQYAG